MKKIKDFFSKHGLIAFVVLFLIMSMRGCVKNGKINRLEKEKVKLEASIDSLSGLVMNPEQKKRLSGNTVSPCITILMMRFLN